MSDVFHISAEIRAVNAIRDTVLVSNLEDP